MPKPDKFLGIKLSLFSACYLPVSVSGVSLPRAQHVCLKPEDHSRVTHLSHWLLHRYHYFTILAYTFNRFYDPYLSTLWQTFYYSLQIIGDSAYCWSPQTPNSCMNAHPCLCTKFFSLAAWVACGTAFPRDTPRPGRPSWLASSDEVSFRVHFWMIHFPYLRYFHVHLSPCPGSLNPFALSIFVHHLRSFVGRSIVWINIIFSGIGSNPAHSIPWRVPHLIFADLQPSPILDIYLALFWDLIVCFNIQRPWWVIC